MYSFKIFVPKLPKNKEGIDGWNWYNERFGKSIGVETAMMVYQAIKNHKPEDEGIYDISITCSIDKFR